MKILITGANGLVGQTIGKIILAKEKDTPLFTGIGKCRIKSFESKYHALDISSFDEVSKSLTQFNPDAVINCAAISHVDVCEQKPDLCDNVNVKGVQNLISGIKLLDSCKLVHLSSDFVFSGQKLDYEEHDAPDPISVYGSSKLKGEHLLKDQLENYQIIRTILVYGFGENLSRNNILTWVYKSLKEEKEIKVVKDQWRTPTYVNDLATSILDLLKTNENGVFHVSGFECTSVFEFAKQIATSFNFNQELISPISSKELNQLGKRPPQTGFSLKKIKKVIKYSPKSIAHGLKAANNQLTHN